MVVSSSIYNTKLEFRLNRLHRPSEFKLVFLTILNSAQGSGEEMSARARRLAKLGLEWSMWGRTLMIAFCLTAMRCGLNSARQKFRS